jgi:hypothetical protein
MSSNGAFFNAPGTEYREPSTSWQVYYELTAGKKEDGLHPFLFQTQGGAQSAP